MALIVVELVQAADVDEIACTDQQPPSRISETTPTTWVQNRAAKPVANNTGMGMLEPSKTCADHAETHAKTLPVKDRWRNYDATNEIRGLKHRLGEEDIANVCQKIGARERIDPKRPPQPAGCKTANGNNVLHHART